MRTFNVTVNGQTYEVSVEEVAQGSAPAAAPVAAAPAAPKAAPKPAAKPAPAAGTTPANDGEAHTETLKSSEEAKQENS